MVIAAIYSSPLYLDVALIYGTLAFVGVVAIARHRGGPNMRIAADILLLMGSVFTFLGALGLLRMPDPYNRIQAGTKAVTLGAMAIMLGIGLLFPQWWGKLLVIAGFILFTNPAGSSTLARAMLIAGVKPWQQSPKTTGEELK